MDNIMLQKIINQLYIKLARQKAAVEITEAQLDDYKKQQK